jgi:hypothetical protein
MGQNDVGGQQRLAVAKNALDLVVDDQDLYDRFRFGVGTFPGGQRLGVGGHSRSTIKQSYAGLSPGGGTPMGSFLGNIKHNELYSEDGDADDDKREKAVVLVTDGCANNQSSAENNAAALKNAGIPVYTVGFNISGSCKADLNAIARQGGTDSGQQNRFWKATQASDLKKALKQIAKDINPCKLP